MSELSADRVPNTRERREMASPLYRDPKFADAVARIINITAAEVAKTCADPQDYYATIGQLVVEAAALDGMGHKLVSTEHELRQTRTELEQALIDLANLRAQVTAAEGARGALVVLDGEVFTSSPELANKVGRLNTLLADQTAENRHLTSTAQHATRLLDKSEAVNAELRQKLDFLSQERNEWQVAAHDAQSEVTRLSEQLAQDQEHHREHVVTNERARRELEDRVAALERGVRYALGMLDEHAAQWGERAVAACKILREAMPAPASSGAPGSAEPVPDTEPLGPR